MSEEESPTTDPCQDSDTDKESKHSEDKVQMKMMKKAHHRSLKKQQENWKKTQGMMKD